MRAIVSVDQSIIIGDDLGHVFGADKSTLTKSFEDSATLREVIEYIRGSAGGVGSPITRVVLNLDGESW